MDVPEVKAEEQCLAVKKGSCNSPDGKKVKISPGETILYQYVEDGSITVHPKNSYCQGVSLPLLKGTLEDQSLVFTQIKFLMLRGGYIRTRGQTAAAKFSRIALPSNCNHHWCLDGSKVYILDEQPLTCPYQKICTASLRLEGTSMMISDDLAMLVNTTKKEVLMLPGCPQLTLYHSSLGTVYLTFNRRAAGLPDIVSDVRSDQDPHPQVFRAPKLPVPE